MEITRATHPSSLIPHPSFRVLLIALLLLVTACSQRRGAVLIAWHTLDGAKERALLKLVDRWNATNADGTVIVLERRDLETLHTSVLNSRATNALPALMLVRPMQAAVYQQQGFLAPLDTYINNPETGWDETDAKDLFPFVRAAGQTPQRETVGLAFGGRARTLIYNQDSLAQLGIEALPQTWKAMNDACALATNRIQNTFCFSVLVTHQTLEDWTAARGGQLVSGDDTLMQVTTDVPTGVMNSLQSYLQSGQAYPTPGAADTRAQFAAGLTPFAFAWSDEIAAYRSAIRQSENFDWRVAALPNDEGQPAGATMQNALWVLLKNDAGNAGREEASWQFVKWLLDEAQTAEWASETGELPARTSALARLAANPTVDPLFISAAQTLAPIARPEPLISGWGCVQSALSAGMRTLFESKPITETVQVMQLGAQSQLGFDCTLR